MGVNGARPDVARSDAFMVRSLRLSKEKVRYHFSYNRIYTTSVPISAIVKLTPIVDLEGRLPSNNLGLCNLSEYRQ